MGRDSFSGETSEYLAGQNFSRFRLQVEYRFKTDRYIGPLTFDLLINTGRYTNFHGYFGVLVHSILYIKLIVIRKNLKILLKFIEQNFSGLFNPFS